MVKQNKQAYAPAPAPAPVSSSSSSHSSCISLNNDGRVRISVTVKPNSSNSCIAAIGEDAVSVHISEPARDGKANSELIDFLSTVLGVKKRDVELEHGSRGHEKVLLISSITCAQVSERLAAAISSNNKD